MLPFVIRIGNRHGLLMRFTHANHPETGSSQQPQNNQPRQTKQEIHRDRRQPRFRQQRRTFPRPASAGSRCFPVCPAPFRFLRQSSGKIVFSINPLVAFIPRITLVLQDGVVSVFEGEIIRSDEFVDQIVIAHHVQIQPAGELGLVREDRFIGQCEIVHIRQIRFHGPVPAPGRTAARTAFSR